MDDRETSKPESTAKRVKRTIVPQRIEASTTELPTALVSSGDLQQLKDLEPGAGGTAITFKALFNKQGTFGQMEFLPSDEEVARLSHFIASDMKWKPKKDVKSSCFLRDNDYHGRKIVLAKLSRAYKDAIAKEGAGLPANNTPVQVEGRAQVRTVKVKGDSTYSCYLTIDTILQLVDMKGSEDVDEEETSDTSEDDE